MGAADSPTPRPYDPGRWARRWGLVAGLMMLVGCFMPRYSPTGFDEGSWRRSWQYFDKMEWWQQMLLVLPAAVGILAVLLALPRRLSGRGLLILLAGFTYAIAPLVIDYYGLLPDILHPTFTPEEWASGRIKGPHPAHYLVTATLKGLALASLIAIASASHVRRRQEASRAARRLAFLGGALYVVSLFFLIVEPIDYRGFWSWRVDMVAHIDDPGAIAMLALSGLLGIGSLQRLRLWPRLRRVIGWLAIAIVVLVAEGRVVGDVFRGYLTYESSWYRWDLLRDFLDGFPHLGGWLLCTIGLAAWIEARIARRPAPSEADLRQVFD